MEAVKKRPVGRKGAIGCYTVDRGPGERDHAFVPQNTGPLKQIHRREKAVRAKFYGDKNGKIELSSQQDTERVLEGIQDKAHIVLNVKTGEAKIAAPSFITSTLQQETSGKLNFQQKNHDCRTGAIRRSRYQRVRTEGLITYMRTILCGYPRKPWSMYGYISMKNIQTACQ
jgi:DNA topoisomerase-1